MICIIYYITYILVPPGNIFHLSPQKPLPAIGWQSVTFSTRPETFTGYPARYPDSLSWSLALSRSWMLPANMAPLDCPRKRCWRNFQRKALPDCLFITSWWRLIEEQHLDAVELLNLLATVASRCQMMSMQWLRNRLQASDGSDVA